MSNSESISEDYIDIIHLTNLMLVVYPNFFIVGKPLYKNRKLSFEKLNYIKIRSSDLECWYNCLCKILNYCESQTCRPKTTIIYETEFSYQYEISVNSCNFFEVQIISNSNRGYEHIFYVEKNEIKYWLNGMGELNFTMLCFPELINKCFDTIVSQFLMIDESMERVSRTIAELSIANIMPICEKFCTKNKQNDSFNMAQIIFRHIVQILITYRIKKSNYISSPLMLYCQSYSI